MNSSLDVLLQTLSKACSAPVSLVKLAEQYEEFILEFDRVPQEAWNVVTAVFSHPELLKRRGIDRFLLEMNVDLPKYSGEQLRELLGLLEVNARYMEQDIARHATGDFIARAYPADLALKTLDRFSQGCAREQQVALVGLDVLRHHVEPPLANAVHSLLEKLLRLQGS
jgi:hypothetical protein